MMNKSKNVPHKVEITIIGLKNILRVKTQQLTELRVNSDTIGNMCLSFSDILFATTLTNRQYKKSLLFI